MAHLRSFAKVHSLAWQQDAVGNLLIKRPGSGGGERAEPVLLQGHVDMVCEANSGMPHNFERDPIRLRMDGSWLRATGTTLGADNGVGVAAALAVLASGPTERLPPIEALFTVDEETGMTGAKGLDGSLITATRLLNLDSEELGFVYIGCAGGADASLLLEAPRAAVEAGSAMLELRISGLRGGHSGVDIHEGRGNANVVAAAVAEAAIRAAPGMRLASLEGGDKRNAIPREATAVLAVPREALTAASVAAQQLAASLRKQHGAVDPGLNIAVTEVDARVAPQEAWSVFDSGRLLSMVRDLPNGVIKWSKQMPGLVETSNNVAAVRSTSRGLEVLMLARSAVASELQVAQGRIEDVATAAGAKVVFSNTYPGWAPVPGSPLVRLAEMKLRERTKVDAKVLAIHAGLECGLLLERCPTIREAVSFGPNVAGAHTPEEGVDVESVEPFFQSLMDILAELAGPAA